MSDILTVLEIVTLGLWLYTQYLLFLKPLITRTTIQKESED
jgi:hypothetical protein